MPPIAESCTGTPSPAHPTVGQEAPETSHPHTATQKRSADDLKKGLKAAATASASPKSVDRSSHDSAAARDCFHVEPCLHSQRMLKQAAVILTTMGQGRPPVSMDRRQSAPAFCKEKRSSSTYGAVAPGSVPPLVFGGPEEKKRTFELALTSLNYQMVFEDILEESDFFKLYLELWEEKELVMVVLQDYQSRKFQVRRWGEEEERWDVIDRIERAIQEQRTKLKACLARRRIKASAHKIEFLLPDSVRRRSGAQKPMPVCAWVNTLKTELWEVLETLTEGGLIHLTIPPQCGAGDQFPERSFYLDPHCSDLLVFSPDCAPHLHHHPLLQRAHLVCQDKSACLAAHSVVHLTTEEHDVLVVNPGPGWVVAHIAVLLQHLKGRVIVVSPHDDHHHAKMMDNIQVVGITKRVKKVKVIRDHFLQLDMDDSLLKNVTSALVIADCSRSAISNIVQYVIMEGENMNLLSKVSEPEDLDGHLFELQADHIAHLRATLNLSKMRGVAYLTRSVHEAENEAVVDKSIEYVNAMQGSGVAGGKQLPWMVTPPVLPFSAQDVEQRRGIEERYVRFHPSNLNNGCFLVCLARRPEDPGNTVARSKSKGLLGKVHKAKKGHHSLEGEGGDEGGGGGDPHHHRRGSSSLGGGRGKRNGRILRRQSSPVRHPALKVATCKVPEHHKVIFHPNPFK